MRLSLSLLRVSGTKNLHLIICVFFQFIPCHLSLSAYLVCPIPIRHFKQSNYTLKITLFLGKTKE